ncbi:MAG: HAD family hydrolase, partial [Candidatus Binatia bacterium]
PLAEHPRVSRKPLVLFDVDGTLLLTGGAGLRAFELAAERLFGSARWFAGIETAGGLDPLIFAEAALRAELADAEARHADFRTAYLELLPAELARGAEQVRALPGVLEAIRGLREDVPSTLGLLTGNYAPAIPIKLRSVGIDPAWFELVACGDDADTRPGLVPIAFAHCERLGDRAEASRTVIVGDTPKDVDCAHAHGCLAFAVATGKFSESELRDAGAEVVVPDLSDPTPLLDLVRELARR